MRVISFRRKAHVRLPNFMASAEQIAKAPNDEERDAMIQFNCAQRAHYNYLENHPSNLVLMLIGGLGYPRATAATSAFWLVNRFLFMIGYTDIKKKNGNGRYLGGLHFVGYAGLLGIAGKVAWDVIMS